MGVSGVGKTAVGKALAKETGWEFADADEFHPAANVAKMRAGIGLDDEDRAPWLKALQAAVADWVTAEQNVVLACSALKEEYRQQLVIGPEVKLVYLYADFELIARRIAERHGHYMNPALLQSQFDTLEVPQEAIAVDVSRSVPEIVATIRSALGV
jgi:gluconokinase